LAPKSFYWKWKKYSSCWK